MADEGVDGYEIDKNEVQQEPEQCKAAAEEAVALNERYLRLYADFENYRKRVNKDKEELIKYGNESLLYELLPVIDSLDLALRHTSDAGGAGILQGVEMTLKELLRTLEKFGLTKIAASDKPFDPAFHHAMSRVERDDIPENMVAEELRAGYLYREKVLRPSLVMVSAKPSKKEEEQAPATQTEEAPEEADNEIRINRIIEEE